MRILSSINEIKKDAWDALSPREVHSSYGWLKTVEETYLGEYAPRYFIVEREGRPCAAAVCYVARGSAESIDMDDQLLGRMKKILGRMGVSFLPALICRPMKASGIHLLFDPSVDPETAEELSGRLVERIEEEAGKQGLPVVFGYVMEHESRLIRRLESRGYHRTLSAPVNYIDIGWSSFSGYLAHIKAEHPGMEKVVRREMNKNRKEGVTIEELESVAGHEERLYELMNLNYRRHNGIDFPFKKEFFRKVKENMGADAVITIARKGRHITGTHIMLKRGEDGYLSMVGVDHQLAGNDFTYFNIAYYRPIADAIALGMKRLWLGVAMYGLKRRRGCSLTQGYLFYKSTHPVKNRLVAPWFWLHAAWWARKVRWIQKR